MKKIYVLMLALVAATVGSFAQQLPDPHFEDWSSSFNNDAQLKNWHGSNVEQVGFKFTFMYQKTGRSGYCAYVADKEVGALGITEVGPGYMGLGTAWQYLEGVSTGTATAGTYGGISFKYRPDTMAVWIKRTGNNTDKEDFHLLYYAWNGTAKSSSYKNKNGGCTGVSQTNEESDVRQALDGNECGTDTKANQIAEGWYRARAKYDNWVQIKVPIFYMNSDVPSMCNVILSAGNYPNFRANSGLYQDNGLWVDDIELIYSSKIQKIYLDNKEWKGFDPDSEEEQVYSLGEKATQLPAIEAWRGAGKLTNVKGTTATFNGRKLSGSEITITNGVIDGTPTTITVKSEDGKSTHVYKIKFVRAPSTNASLAGIKVNGEEIANFKPSTTTYNVELPYGTKKAPVVEAITAEDGQSVSITQATSPTGTATLNVTAPDKKTTKKYTLSFSVALLSDNRLKGIKVNGEDVPGFNPTLNIYKVSLPLSTTSMPKVDTLSFYPAGEQTVVHTAPDKIDGGTYQIAVSTPGNQTPKVYKLTFKLEASSYAKLKDLKIGGTSIEGFDPDILLYYVNLPLGTTSLPEITPVPGDQYQKVDIVPGGLNGTTRVTVTAGNGDQVVYKIVIATKQSDESSLNMIYLDGQPLEGFSPTKLSYDVELHGTTTLPKITWDKAEENETCNVLSGGLNGTTRISVTAQDGSQTVYMINFKVILSTDNSLRMIYLDGVSLAGFDADKLEYTYNLAKDQEMPVITWDEGESQTITTREVNGEFRITVRPQSGATKTYKIKFVVATSSNTQLAMIYVNKNALDGFRSDSMEYTYTLTPGETVNITYKKQEDVQSVQIVPRGDQYLVIVTAEDKTSKETYYITFETEKNSNANLAGISLVVNGDTTKLKGFDPEEYEYHYTLTTATCPRIVVKEEPGQHVTISTPVSVGVAQIRVQAESGGTPNIYRIYFEDSNADIAELKKVYLDGERYDEFEPTQKSYTIEKGVQEVTWEKMNETDSVEVLRTKNVVRLFVTSGRAVSVYTFTFTEPQSTIATVDEVYFDGVKYAAFKSDQLNYVIDLAAGQVVPTITFVKSENAKESYFGQVAEREYEIKVMPESGDVNTYHFKFQNAKYSDATLTNIELVNIPLSFVPTKSDYAVELENGAQLPDVILTTKPGQTTLLLQNDADHHQIVVTAEDGSEMTYTITYARKQSNNTKLANIFVDGVALEGFSPDKTDYIDSLAWRTRVIPSVQAVAQVATQTVTTYYCNVNGTLHINVKAENGDEGNYYIEFPVRKSGNVELGSLYLGSDDAELEYKPSQTDYDIVMPYQSKAAPTVVYTKAEPEQTIEFISRPLGQTSQIIVTAENGDQRTYNLYFHAEEASEANRLAAISVRIDNNPDLEEDLSLKDKTKRNFEVNVPYGSRTLSVEYDKMFPEQTVFVQPGGVTKPTILTVKSNRKGETDEVYTITPIVGDKNPAVITALTVNGVALEGFDPYNYSYIVPVENKHIIRYTLNKGVELNVLEQTEKHWQAEVTYNDIVTIYDLWFYYTNDVLPNTEFDQWENAAYKGVKPVGWNTLGHFTEGKKFTLVGTYTTGNEVTKDGTSVVKMESKYNAFPLGGYVPAYITLGTIQADFSVAAGSDFGVSGGMTFRNSPDELKVNFKQTEISNNASRIVYQVTGSLSTQEQVYTNKTTQSAFTTISMDLRPTNAAAGIPQSMNVILNSFESEAGRNGTEASAATMYVDWARFYFNHTLTGLKVDNIAAELTDKAFAVTLTNPERIEIPVLNFTGDVEDQAQLVTWNAETKSGEYGVRTATIRNFAENGIDYTDYTLTVKRPLDTRNVLSAIKFNGVELGMFDDEKNDYEYHLKSTQKELPDFEVVPASSRQTIAMEYKDSVMSVTVTPEYGEARTYKVKFITDLSDDVTLKSLSHVSDFVPATKQYTLDAQTYPIFTFEKQYDGQIVDVKDGLITVTAENGAKGTYEIALAVNDDPTSAQLKEFVFDGKDVMGFGEGTYEKINEGAHPMLTSFARVSEGDTVVYIQSAANMTWEVYGYKAQHTYKLLYPTNKSEDADLKTILVNGEPLERFAVGDYTIYTDSAVAIQPMGKDGLKQTIAIQPKNATNNAPVRKMSGGAPETEYVIVVTAEDGIHTKTYDVEVKPTQTDITTLASIKLNGVEIEGFRPDSFTYAITLPTPAIKLAEPEMPSLTYESNDAKQKVEVTEGKLNKDDAKLLVTAANGVDKQEYLITVNSEPSHNAYLSGIMVNGLPVEEFEIGRHNYSANSPTNNIDISWASNDNFQNVQLKVDSTDYGTKNTIVVTAQDGVTVEEYYVKVYVQALSNDAELADVLLNGKPFDRFETALNPGLSFEPQNSSYAINLESGTTTTPKISATMKVDGQTVEIRQQKMTVYLDVTAKDGTTKKTYTLDFLTPPSTNAQLSMINIDTLSIDAYTKGQVNFYPDKYRYDVELPVGVHEIPDVVAFQGQKGQTGLENPVKDGNIVTITVLAEDKLATQTYTVGFNFTQSAVDTLAVILADGDTIPNISEKGDTIPGFDGSKDTYNLTLPAGTTAFPQIEPWKGDEWQKDPKVKEERYILYKDTIVMEFDTIPVEPDTFRIDTVKIDTLKVPYYDPNRLTYRITTEAENGHSKTYIINYEIAKSDVDTLMAIYIDNKSIETFTKQPFNSHVYDYYVTLDATATDLPEVLGMPGEINQIVYNETVDEQSSQELPDSVKAVNKKIEIHVQAQSGKTRIYTIHFSMKKSDYALLNMIQVNGKNLSGFDAEQIYYRGEPLGCKESVPVVTFAKGHEGQIGDISIVNGDGVDTVFIKVTAEDGKENETYKIVFEPVVSENFFLKNIVFSDGYYIPFDSLQAEYTLEIPFGVDTVPNMTVVASDECQTIVVDSVRWINETTAQQFITVYPYNNTMENVYTITYIFRRKGDASLKSIMINGEPLIDFKPEVSDYNIVFPSGTDSTQYYKPENVTYELSDSLATDSIWMDETFTILIEVKAQDGSRTTYSLHQMTGESDDNLLKDLLLDGVTIRDFDPEVQFYTYYVGAGKTAPEVTAVAHDPKADISIKPGENIGDTTLIMCTAENNETRVYQILFTYTEIDDAQKPEPHDVLIKRLFGTMDIFVASLRSNVQFYLFDRNGRMVNLVEMIPPCDQNDAIITVNANGEEVLQDVIGDTSGVRVTLNPNTLYFYTFTEDNKRYITSGKIIIVNDAAPAK